jgi:hypothetical protein
MLTDDVDTPGGEKGGFHMCASNVQNLFNVPQLACHFNG